jgi:protein SCO1/2
MRRILLLAICGAAFAGCGRQPAFEPLEEPPPAVVRDLRRLWQVPEFHLIERSGKLHRRGDFAGKIWVADFFYSTCPGPCPMMTSRLSALQEKLGQRDGVLLVSISVDPGKDTPEVLAQYAERFKASASWLFFTGDKAAIFDLANKGFKLSVTEQTDGSEPITHSTKLALVDQEGWVRGFYEGVGADESDALVADIERLVAERID